MKTAAIYIIKDQAQFGPHVAVALRELCNSVDHLILVAHAAIPAETIAALPADCQPHTLMRLDQSTLSLCYLAGLNALTATPSQIILTGAHAYGPITPINTLLEQAKQLAPDGLFAAYGTRSLRAITDIPSGQEP
ncbi:MAG: hypothetical protein ACJA06_002030, partial [Halocynthiibacter sp.]